MDDKQFDIICKKLDKIVSILAVQGIEERDKKIYVLKESDFSSEEIEKFLGVSNVRRSEGWKRK